MTGRPFASAPRFRPELGRKTSVTEEVSIGVLHCPDCSANLDRIAYRDGDSLTRNWRSFGYRCNGCQALFIEKPQT